MTGWRRRRGVGGGAEEGFTQKNKRLELLSSALATCKQPVKIHAIKYSELALITKFAQLKSGRRDKVNTVALQNASAVGC